jgi:hypothetical protein
VRAGLLAAVESGFMVAAGTRWRIVEMRPGERPLSRLTSALLQQGAVGLDGEPSPVRAALLEAGLRRGPLGLVEALRERPDDGDSNLLLLVDQFEEIFRFRARGNDDEADGFVALLLASAIQGERPIYVIITMRSDFLGECTLFRGLPEAINDSQYLTPRLTREQCRQAIVGPSRVFGGHVAPALVNRLLNDFGPDPDQLPLLQHALMRMWRRASERARRSGTESGGAAAAPTLSVDDYEELGGLDRALSDHADEVLAELAPPARHLAQVMFRRLTERGIGKRDTRAPASLGDVAAVAGVSVEEVRPVVEAFRRPDRSFVTPPAGTMLDRDTRLDIGHESLIRQWRLLADWVELESRSATTYARLRQTAQLWQAGESALWRNPDLERALRWEQSERPSTAWAERYGTADDFDLAMRFLRESETAWRDETRREVAEQERRQQEEVERRTREEHEKRLLAEARAGRTAKRAAYVGGILTVVLALGWGAAWLKAREADAARTLAEVQQRLAIDNAEAAKAAAAEAMTSRDEARRLLERLTNSDRLKRAFLTADAEVIAAAAAHQSPLAGFFGARRRARGWKTRDGLDVSRYEMFPLPDAIRGPLAGATQISYFMNHPTFQQKVITAGPGDGFVGAYDGWGCLARVYVLIEYASPDRRPEAITWGMCAAVREVPPG